jgi:hypothetical protein
MADHDVDSSTVYLDDRVGAVIAATVNGIVESDLPVGDTENATSISANHVRAIAVMVTVCHRARCFW